MGYLRVDCRTVVSVHLVTLPCPSPVGDQQSRHENHLDVNCPGVEQVARGLRTLYRTRRVGSGAASLARILEQGLALDELVEMKTSIERGVQGESGGDQSQPTEGAAGRVAVPPSSELSVGEGVAARRERDIPAEAGKYSSS